MAHSGVTTAQSISSFPKRTHPTKCLLQVVWILQGSSVRKPAWFQANEKQRQLASVLAQYIKPTSVPAYSSTQAFLQRQRTSLSKQTLAAQAMAISVSACASCNCSKAQYGDHRLLSLHDPMRSYCFSNARWPARLGSPTNNASGRFCKHSEAAGAVLLWRTWK